MVKETNTFHKASTIVKEWGQFIVPNGRSVEEALTINGISLWAVISPSLALEHVARLLSEPTQQVSLRDYFVTLLKKNKRLALEASISLFVNSKGCEVWPLNPAFLFLGFSHYIYRETLQPVADRIANRPDCSVVIMDDVLPFQTRKHIHEGAEFQSLWQHWDSDVVQTVKNMRKELYKAANELVSPAGLPRIVSESGMDWKSVRYVFAWLFDSLLPRLVTQAAIALHIIEKHRPALLISPDVNDPRTRIFCLAGKLSGIQTLEVQFAFHEANAIEWRFFIADHLAVPGETSKDVMISHGIPREKMSVTGSPCYDSMLSCSSKLKSKVRGDLKIPDGNRMILLASQPNVYGAFINPKFRREMICALFYATSMLDGITLVVKPHPLEDTRELEHMASGERNILFADKATDIKDLIKVADVFVTFFSTTAFHALVMKKAVINISFPGAYTSNLFEQSGATLVARNAEDISRILQFLKNGQLDEILANLAPARERFLQKWFYKLDGCASERIESIALEMSLGRFSDFKQKL